MTSFKDLGLKKELLKAIEDLEYKTPSPIQVKTIPFILKEKKDLIALAQTGTGKTAAFSLPIINQISGKELSSIILCPTRELCLQISEDIKKFSKYSNNIKTTAVYGGKRIDNQIKSIKQGTNIVVGTPGRVCDLIRRKTLKLNNIKYLVLDEADEMLDMGFKEDLDAILAETPKKKQTLLFSATISNNVNAIAKTYMNDSEEIRVGDKNIGAEKVEHHYYVVNARNRFEALKRIIDSMPDIYGIIFCRTRNQTQEITDKLKQIGYNTEALHGDISQNMRTKIMKRFKDKKIKLLIATDVAARGIDVNNLSHIINYNLPDQNETYIHRSGRTGRVENSGIAISILSPGEIRKIKSLEKIVKKEFVKKDVPSGKDIYKKQVKTFIININNKKNIDRKRKVKDLFNKLQDIDKDKLIDYLIDTKFSSLINNYYEDKDINENDKGKHKEQDINKINLKINFGKKDGFNIQNVFSLINSHKNIKNVEIGRIDLYPKYSVFSVEKNKAREVIKTLNNTKFKGRNIKVNFGSNNSKNKFNTKKRKKH